jgi:hypothetical protein
MRLFGALSSDSGELPSPSEAQDGLQALNQMIEAWSVERLAIFTVTPKTFPLIDGKQTYTVGTGGDFNIPRPPQIDWLSIVYQANPPQPLEMPIRYITDPAEWRGITLKNFTNIFPSAALDDQGFPFRTLTFWPIPSGASLQVVIYSWQALAEFPDGGTVLTFPPGYAEAIRFNLAVRLAPEFGRSAPVDVKGLAVEALARVRRANMHPIEMRCEDALLGTRGYNYVDFVSGK